MSTASQAKVVFSKKKIGQLLLDNKIITETQLGDALELQKQQGGRVGEILINKGYINEQTLMVYLGKQCGIEYVSLANIAKIPQEVLDIIPVATAKRHIMIPIKKDGRKLTVAMADPLNVFVLDDIKLTTGLEVIPVLTGTEEINKAITTYYAKTKSKEELAVDTEQEYVAALEKASEMSLEEDANADQSMQLDVKSIDAPVIKLCNAIVAKAIQVGASDIHLEPYEKSFRVRYRIDGVLHEQPYPPKTLQNAIIARFKVLARADISERRVPQDGRIKLKIESKAIDLRISFLPTVFGEKVVMRILDSSGLKLDLDHLGLEPENRAIFEKAINAPHGLVLITGPTGSGKSTTLYSVLFVLNQPSRNIMTCEDPVEYMIPGINQVNVKKDVGLTFAAGLRSFLRQDPDIILVGEIRDQETAEIAANAAMTGHMVFATLHTNDATSAPARLLYMGVEPFLVGTSLLAVVAQRLVRTICANCKESYQIGVEEFQRYGLQLKSGKNADGKVTLYKGKGCERCSGTGYKGRVGIHEVLDVTEEVREAIVRKAPPQEIAAIAAKNNMLTLRDSCTAKVLKGMTTMEELLRITMEH